MIPLSSFIHPSYLNEDLDYYKEILIYSSHGTQDEVIPITLVEDYIMSLGQRNDLIFEKFESGHTISQKNLINIINWIEETKI